MKSTSRQTATSSKAAASKPIRKSPSRITAVRAPTATPSQASKAKVSQRGTPRQPAPQKSGDVQQSKPTQKQQQEQKQELINKYEQLADHYSKLLEMRASLADNREEYTQTLIQVKKEHRQVKNELDALISQHNEEECAPSEIEQIQPTFEEEDEHETVEFAECEETDITEEETHEIN